MLYLMIIFKLALMLDCKLDPALEPRWRISAGLLLVLCAESLCGFLKGFVLMAVDVMGDFLVAGMPRNGQVKA